MPEEPEQEESEETRTARPVPPHLGPGADGSYVARLQKLDLWVETLARLKQGDSGRSIAVWLIQERGFPAASESGLKNALNKFRAALPPGQLVPPTAMPSWLKKASKELLTGEGLLQDLEWGLALTRQRIRQGRQAEKVFPLPSRQTGEDLELLRKMAETKARLAMELGVVTRAPQEVNVLSASLGMYADLAATLSPPARGRVLEVAAHVIRQARAAAGEGPGVPVPGNGGEDGSHPGEPAG